MKKLSFIAALMIISRLAAQTQSACFPTNSGSGQVEIKGNVVMDGKQKGDILDKIIVWGAQKSSFNYDNDKNSSNAPFFKDRDAGVFKFLSQIMYPYKEGFRTVYFGVTIHVKDGAFDYLLSDFSMNKKPMETFLMTKEGDEFYKESFTEICKRMTLMIDELKALK